MWSGSEVGELAQVRPQLRVDVHVEPQALVRTLREEAQAGLGARFKELSPKWLYDDEGSRLFDEITRLPEYYPTRCEREILQARAEDIARASGADTLVELGSGTSEKTQLLLEAFSRQGSLRRFVPFDVSENTLREAAAQVSGRYPGLLVHAVAGDFEQHLGHLPAGGRRMVAFLGGTVGNLKPAQRRAFLTALATTMAPGDTLLMGTDLVKDRTRLVRAYDDAAGVTAAFNKNVLVRLNRELGADFQPEAFEHVARFDEAHSWIEMRLRSRASQQVRVPQLGMTVRFEKGEEMRTEVSTKFRPEQVRAELSRAGFQLARWWTDRGGDFALSLAVRTRG